jgi:myotubularin-related protein 14
VPRCRASREYRAFDLVTLTQQYVKILLQLLAAGSVSCHCISGWDRTPLFVSLLRISLWADGAAHESLSVDEILYLTVAYDWMLFGHQLRDRATRNEMVFTFCFDVLQHLESSEFSVDHADARDAAPREASSSAPSPARRRAAAATTTTGTALGAGDRTQSPIEIELR